MFIIYLVLGLILLIACWVIFVPVNIELNISERNLSISQPISFSIRMNPLKSQPMELRVLGIKLTNLSPSIQKKQQKKGRKEKSDFSRSRKAWLALVRNASRSLRLKSVWLDIDTGDVVANAKLVPLALLASSLHEKALVQINFQGKVEGWLRANISLYILLAAFILFLTSK